MLWGQVKVSDSLFCISDACISQLISASDRNHVHSSTDSCHFHRVWFDFSPLSYLYVYLSAHSLPDFNPYSTLSAANAFVPGIQCKSSTIRVTSRHPTSFSSSQLKMIAYPAIPASVKAIMKVTSFHLTQMPKTHYLCDVSHPLCLVMSKHIFTFPSCGNLLMHVRV